MLSCICVPRVVLLQIFLPEHLVEGLVDEQIAGSGEESSADWEGGGGRGFSLRSREGGCLFSQSQDEEEDSEGMSIQIGGDVAIFNDVPFTHAQRLKLLKENHLQRSV